jgi:hypothetical protein
MARRGNLRASDDDRERAIERLHRAATEGRIAAHELEQRVAAALKARTYGELDETTADLPGPPRRRGVQRRPAAGWALSAVRANPLLLLFAIPALAVTAAMLVAATVVWMVLMIVVLVLGGRPRGPRPWRCAARHRVRSARRGTGGYWA